MKTGALLKKRIPGDVGKCGPSCPPHHWNINRENIGRCVNDGCTMVRDFGALQSKINGSSTRIYFLPREQLPFGYAEELEVRG